MAAGTTSLPEWIGGGRNWDYRFTWIRDATLTLASLALLGYLGEAAAFKGWLERTGGRPARRPHRSCTGDRGARLLPELDVGRTCAAAGVSVPVRIGNAAAGQHQLDSLGQLLEAGYLFQARRQRAHRGQRRLPGPGGRSGRTPMGAVPTRASGRSVMRRATSLHSSSTAGWPSTSEVRHGGMAVSSTATWILWRGTSGTSVAAWLHSEGSPDGWFVQAAGHQLADASALLVPALGFLPPAHPRVLATIDVVQRDLKDGGHVHRYRSPDGLPGDEGAFLLCSFWLLDALTHSGRLDEAETLLERLFGLANDVGLYAEMVDPATGRAVWAARPGLHPHGHGHLVQRHVGRQRGGAPSDPVVLLHRGGAGPSADRIRPLNAGATRPPVPGAGVPWQAEPCFATTSAIGGRPHHAGTTDRQPDHRERHRARGDAASIEGGPTGRKPSTPFTPRSMPASPSSTPPTPTR